MRRTIVSALLTVLIGCGDPGGAEPPPLTGGAETQPGEDGGEASRGSLAIAAIQDQASPRFDFRASSGAYLAAQPRYRTTTTVSAVGVVARHLDLGWEASLSLGAIGRARPTPAPEVEHVVQDGNRVDLVRGPVTESYVNGPAGLEQRFEIAEPIGREEGGELVLELSLAGDLRVASVASRVVSLADGKGEARAELTELVATDESGRLLPAHFTGEGATVRIHVNDEGASYPITVDPLLFVHQQSFVASDGASFDNFGAKIARDGSTAVISATGDDAPASSSGSVYVFQQTPSGWVEQQKLVPTDSAANQRFGGVLALSGDWFGVGQPLTNIVGSQSGAVYLFSRLNGTWSQHTRLSPLDAAASDHFGAGVALEGDTLLVGAPHEDDAGNDAGAVYVFEYDGASWVQRQKLTVAGSRNLGRSVAMRGDVAIAGAPGESVPVNSSGAAYILRRTAGSWSVEQRIQPSDVGVDDLFGWVTAIDGQRAIVGVENDDHPVAGANAGSAYIYAFDGATWQLEQKLVASDAVAGYSLGRAADIDGDVAVVGSPGWRDPNPSINISGATYVFARIGGTWVEQEIKQATPPNFNASFGASIALEGSTVLLGHERAFTESGGFSSGSVEFHNLVNVDATPCLDDAECTTGFCVDGFCCDEACDGQCDTCNRIGQEGVCSPAADGSAGTPACSPYVCDGTGAECPSSCTGPSDCAPDHYCSAGGTCLLEEANGSPCDSSVECASGRCVDSVCCNAACDGPCDACNLQGAAGVCEVLDEGEIGSPSCSPYACDGAVSSCPASCTEDADCIASHHCSAAGACEPDKGNGEECALSNECASTFCADGVCCASSCDGACDVCDAAGEAGQCSTVAQGEAGAPSCSPYVCDGTSPECPTSCTAESDCVAGTYCDETGQCQSDGTLGSPCTDAEQCASAICVEGVCCDSACGDGDMADCQACTIAAGAAVDGLCGPLASGTACRASASQCDAVESCDGLDPSCPVDGFVTNGSACEDGDACTEPDSCQDGLCQPGEDGCGGGGGEPNEGAGGQGGSPVSTGGGGSGEGGRGGSGGAGGSSSDDGGSPPPDEGCACSTPARTERGAAWAAVMGLALLLRARRKRSASE